MITVPLRIRNRYREGIDRAYERNAFAALNLANRGYVLQTGRAVLAGTGKELLADKEVQQAYLG